MWQLVFRMETACVNSLCRWVQSTCLSWARRRLLEVFRRGSDGSRYGSRSRSRCRDRIDPECRPRWSCSFHHRRRSARYCLDGSSLCKKWSKICKIFLSNKHFSQLQKPKTWREAYFSLQLLSPDFFIRIPKNPHLTNTVLLILILVAISSK